MYKLSDVAQATSVPARTLTDWLSRKLVDVPTHGSGTHRRFDKDDVVRIGIIAELVRLGVSVSAAAKAASAFSDESHGGRDIGELFPSGKTVLIADGDSARCINVADREQFESAMLSVYEDVRSVIAVVVNTVVARVDRALASGSSPRGAVAMLYRHGKQMHV